MNKKSIVVLIALVAILIVPFKANRAKDVVSMVIPPLCCQGRGGSEIGVSYTLWSVTYVTCEAYEAIYDRAWVYCEKGDSKHDKALANSEQIRFRLTAAQWGMNK